MLQTFGIGAKGFLIGELQAGLERGVGRRLHDGIDCKYGTDTATMVIEFARMQSGATQDEMRRQLAFNGMAGPVVWNTLGVAWPELFARCLQLTSCFEGTGFSGSCGPKQTGDTAGVTFGIIGFTSYNGELQELLETARSLEQDQFDRVSIEALGRVQYREMRNAIVDEDKRAFERWALTKDGSVFPGIKKWLEALGEMPWMRRLEMQWAHDRYWKLAQKQVKALFGDGATNRVYALFYDIAVQNGGLKQLEVSDLAIDFRKDRYATEPDKMHQVNTKLIDRLRQAKRPTRIIEDVRSRKGTIVMGSGTVHGSKWQIRSFAL